MMRRLVILDRDGVINRHAEGYVLKPEHWEPMPGALEAIARLHHAGFAIAVATNQAALSRGLYDMAMVNSIHQRMSRLVEAAGGRIDAIAICPHNPEHGCGCRKPQPGMLRELIERFEAVPHETAMIGDALADVHAGIGAGCRTWLVRCGHGEQAIAQGPLPDAVTVCADLAEATELLLAEAARARPAN